jgi:GAF domain-containing protein
MAFKIKHIATRFLLQSIFTILIIGTLIFIMFYSGYRKKDTLKAISTTEAIKSNIVIMSLNLDKAFDLQQADPKFVETSADMLLATQNGLINGIIDSVSTLNSIKYLQPLFNKSNVSDSILATVQDYSINFSKVLLTLKEKGNKFGGLINSATIAIQRVSNELITAPDDGLQAANFKSYTSAYLVDYSYSALVNLSNYCDEIITPFYYMDGFDYSTLELRVSALKEVLLHIQLVDLRLIDNSNGSGQLVDVKNSYDKLYANFDSLNQAIRKETNSYNSWWNWVFTILAVLLTIAYIIVMGRFSQIVRKSVKSLHKVTIALSNGSINDTVPEGGYYEFNVFNKDLKSLFSLLNRRKEFIQNLLNDEFNMQLEVKSEYDEIGKLLQELQEKMTKAQQKQILYNEENSVRQYMNEGLARFGEIMRVNSSDTIKLADVFIKELVKYMNALQGGLFLTEEGDSENIHLVSAFAFDRKRFLNKVIKKGESLVGTCAAEGKTINLTEIPENFISIKSGLGDTPPNNILIIPVINDEILVGVIEIASLNIFREIEIELAENIASSLAATILAVRNNTKTTELLLRSQQQAAEMAEQEEEMRQNMEELKATQEESARREDEMQGLLNAIGTSFYVLEYDLSGAIIHVNERLALFIQQPYEQILKRQHHDIFSSDSIITNDMIKDIINKKHSITSVETLNWGRKKYQYKYNLSPVFSENGEVTKVLNLFSIDEVKTES